MSVLINGLKAWVLFPDPWSEEAINYFTRPTTI